MPIYEYQCKKCEEQFEILHKVREVKEDITCPSCGGADYHRLFSVPSKATFGSMAARTPSSPCEGCTGESCHLD